ncbi:MAG: cupredoxin domain-containing protein [Nanoarchaeota archaeon]|nr:cupredoxin domain-containing protein [Nanoarchaeota archaeon]
MAKPSYLVPAVVFTLIIAFVVYIIMIPPHERAVILQEEEAKTQNTVVITDKMFVPQELKIKQGETVVWINKDNIKHKINGVGFKSPTLNPGDRYYHTFDEKGVYVYSSELYPAAVGTIVVE